jgi:hypothetical protein
MIPQFPSVSSFSHARSHSSVSVLGRSCAPATKSSLGCRLIQMTLALYLIPAFLIVLLVGVVGIVLVGVVRLLARLLSTTTAD